MPILPLPERVELLRDVAAFAHLSPEALHELAGLLEEERYDPESVVVREGEPIDKLYVIAEGRTEVTTETPGGTITLATQEASEIFGELALLSAVRRQRARRSVTALTPLLVLTLTAAPAEAFVLGHPDARVIFETSGEVMLVARFLKRATPFARLSLDRARWLATRLESRTVEEGTDIIRQGEYGDSCFLLRAGRVEVLTCQDEETERRISTLGPGFIFGETALLSEEPDNVTVRALEPTELLALRRADLLEAMRADRQVEAELVELVRLRDRPRRAPHIAAYQQTTADGQTIFILKNPAQHTYYRLSSRGWFLWQRLDGQHTFRDLTLDYREAFGSFVPQVVTDLVKSLASGGFVLLRTLRKDVARLTQPEISWQRAATMARSALEFQLALRNVDAAVTRVYRRGIFLLYTWPGQIGLAVLGLAGFYAFVLSTVRAATFISQTDGGAASLLFILPAEWLSVVVHEAGHAFTAKAFGREVSRVGIGWYWFGPTVFVDTSDMWLAGRWPRIAVSLAGPWANIVLAGIAGVVGFLASSDVVTAVCWQVALTSYVMVVLNLDPLLEYDGYYILMDWLERPNLRKHCLSWLGHELPGAVLRPDELRSHRLELIYGLGSLLYVLFMGLLTLIVYRLVVQSWISYLLPRTVATALAWVFALGAIVLTIMAVAGELRGTRRGAAGASS